MLLLSSCSTFREYFDEDPAKAKAQADAKAGAKTDAAKKAPAQTAPAKRDPVIPDFFGTRKKDDYILSSELSEAEKASLKNTNMDASGADIDAINRKNEEIKKKQHQSVWGI